MTPRRRALNASATRRRVAAGQIHRGAGRPTGNLNSTATPMLRNAAQIPQTTHPASTAPTMAVQNGGRLLPMIGHVTTPNHLPEQSHG